MDACAHKEAGERAEKARESLRCCKLCPRLCGVDRTGGEKGYCGLDDSVRCFREMLYWGEEEELRPSHQVYFAGCSLRCGFCTVGEWNKQPEAAEELDGAEMSKKIAERRKEGARTLNLLGGEPTVSLHGVLELLGRVEPTIRVVLNSNMYYNDIVERLLRGFADVYLADLKCGNAECAGRLLGAADYTEVAKRNILESRRDGELIVRHLVLPGHGECCLRPILSWVADELPEVKLSLRGDYVPPAESDSAPAEYLRRQELDSAMDLAKEMGLNLIE